MIEHVQFLINVWKRDTVDVKYQKNSDSLEFSREILINFN